MGNDIERIIVSHKRTEVQSGNILNTILITYARAKFLVSPNLVAQDLYLMQEIRVGATKLLAALLRTRIEHSSIGKNNAG